MSQKLKKILSGIGLLAAFGLGGAALAGAQGGGGSGGDRQEHGDQGERATGPAADRAGRAAVAAVGGGKAVSVDRETHDQGADQAEPGDTPDSAQEQAIDAKTAYSVEVQRVDGTESEVALDDAFQVLKVDHEQADGDQES